MRFLTIILFIAMYGAQANMANPVTPGSLIGQPFVAAYADILHENIYVTIDETFNKANFRIEYYIHSEEKNAATPFLFYASEFHESFEVKVDGQPVSILKVPDHLNFEDIHHLDDFRYLFSHPDNDFKTIQYHESENESFEVDLSDLIYFEIDLSKGEHLIEIQYIASHWEDASSWVKNYSFRYVLSPAKYWRSFGTLHLFLDASEFTPPLQCNLSPPDSGNIDHLAFWKFDALPGDIVTFEYHPQINKLAQMMIDLQADGMAIIVFTLLFLLHIYMIMRYRKNGNDKTWSPVVIVGSIVVPLLLMACWILYFVLIDKLIGPHSSSNYGYAMLIFMFSPIAIPAYFILIWLIDQLVKHFVTPTVKY